MRRFVFLGCLLVLQFAVFAHKADTSRGVSLLDSTTWCKLIKMNDRQMTDSEVLCLINDTAHWRTINSLSLSDFTQNTELITRHSLPKKQIKDPSLYFTAYSGSGFSLFLNNREIYSCLTQHNISLHNYYVSKVVSLDTNYTEKYLYMWMPYKDVRNTGVFKQFLIGSRDKMIDQLVFDNLNFVTKNIVNLIMGVLLVAVFIVSSILFIIQSKKANLWLLFFGLFLLLAAFTINSEYIRVVSNASPQFLSYLDFITAALLPVFFIGFLLKLFQFPLKSVLGLVWITATLFGLFFCLFPLNNTVLYVYWTLNLLYVLIGVEELIRKKIHRQTEYKFLFWGNTLFSVCVIVQFVINLVLPDWTFISPFQIGLFIFILLFGLHVVQNYMREKQFLRASQLELETARNKLLLLERESVISQYEALKNQINPHFLFNCLNSLNSLIRTDGRKAILFVEEFSDIYRYVLDVKDKATVQLRDELQFIRSYFFLQQIRYGENLQLAIYLDDEILSKSLPPLSLQLLVENAIKHNEISQQNPLRIQIHQDGDFIVVQNNLQIINVGKESKGIGLQNLTMRYEQLTDKLPSFTVDGQWYMAKVPLLSEE